MTINDRIEALEQEIKFNRQLINNLAAQLGKKDQPPITTFGGSKSVGTNYPIDVSSGLSTISGGAVCWNDTEINAPYGVQPNTPTKSYNKHSHSRFSGGALIKGVIEVIEYDWGTIDNKHSQGFLKQEDQPKIKKVANTAGEPVEKIGLLDLVFNADGGHNSDGVPIGTWGCPAYEIDVAKCYLVERVTVVDSNNPVLGAIKKDTKGHKMESPLYNTDTTKTSVVWDENGQCWRFYAVFAPVPAPTP